MNARRERQFLELAFVLLVPASFGLLGCGGPHHGGGRGASHEAIRHITVVGHGEAKGSPDIARTSLGVEASAATVEEAMNQTSARMKASVVSSNGVPIPSAAKAMSRTTTRPCRPFGSGSVRGVVKTR